MLRNAQKLMLRSLVDLFVYIVQKGDSMIICFPKLVVKTFVNGDPVKITISFEIVLFHEFLTIIHCHHEHTSGFSVEQNMIYFRFRESELNILSKLKVVKSVLLKCFFLVLNLIF